MMRGTPAAWRLGTALLPVLAALAIYAPALGHGVLLLDDTLYLRFATSLEPWRPADLWRMLGTFHASNWHPLTWFSLSLDRWLFGHGAFGHHLVNSLLHALNTLLVWLLAWRLLGAAPGARLVGASAAALLFAVHPQHVEAVAWIAERKELLCASAYIGALLSHLHYAAAAGQRAVPCGLHPLTVVLGILALAAKPMAVSLPLVLLLLDLYPLRRWTFTAPLREVAWRGLVLLLEKGLLIAAAACTALLTVKAQEAGDSLRSLVAVGLPQRLLNAAYNLFFYPAKFVLPLDLSPYYPFPSFTAGRGLLGLLAPGAALALSAWTLWQARRGRPLWLAAWGAYVVTLLPVAGVVQVGWQGAADRYAYLTTLPLYLGFGWACAWAWQARDQRVARAAGALLLGYLLLVAALTPPQVRVWASDERLWLQANALYPGHWLIESNLAFHLARRGRLGEAETLYRRSLARFPHERARYVQLAELLASDARHAEAQALYARLAALEPSDAFPLRRLAEAARRAGDTAAERAALEGLQRLEAGADASTPSAPRDASRRRAAPPE